MPFYTLHVLQNFHTYEMVGQTPAGKEKQPEGKMGG